MKRRARRYGQRVRMSSSSFGAERIGSVGADDLNAPLTRTQLEVWLAAASWQLSHPALSTFCSPFALPASSLLANRIDVTKYDRSRRDRGGSVSSDCTVVYLTKSCPFQSPGGGSGELGVEARGDSVDGTTTKRRRYAESHEHRLAH